MCMCLLRTCSCYQSLSSKDFEFCHFCLSIHYSLLSNRTLDSTNDCTTIEKEKFIVMLQALNVDPGFQLGLLLT